jgi:hypothetical protein
MSLFDIDRDTLEKIPMVDLLRERLSSALDQFGEKIEIGVRLDRRESNFQRRPYRNQIIYLLHSV